MDYHFRYTGATEPSDNMDSLTFAARDENRDIRQHDPEPSEEDREDLFSTPLFRRFVEECDWGAPFAPRCQEPGVVPMWVNRHLHDKEYIRMLGGREVVHGLIDTMPAEHVMISPNGSEAYAVPAEGAAGVHLTVPDQIINWQEILRETELGVKHGFDRSIASSPYSNTMYVGSIADFRYTARDEEWRSGLAGPPAYLESTDRLGDVCSHDDAAAREAGLSRLHAYASPLSHKMTRTCRSADLSLIHI